MLRCHDNACYPLKKDSVSVFHTKTSFPFNCQNWIVCFHYDKKVNFDAMESCIIEWNLWLISQSVCIIPLIKSYKNTKVDNICDSSYKKSFKNSTWVVREWFIFTIVTLKLGSMTFPPGYVMLVSRCIHTSNSSHIIFAWPRL